MVLPFLVLQTRNLPAFQVGRGGGGKGRGESEGRGREGRVRGERGIIRKQLFTLPTIGKSFNEKTFL